MVENVAALNQKHDETSVSDKQVVYVCQPQVTRFYTNSQLPRSVFVCSLSTQPLKTTGKNLGKEMSPESAEV